ncbi:recombinase family protein [Armatimonas sp.]|uniref:recombinase family protein n=1 Tax=Armatimonas sp. TaxID=1872638 RepID=UPI0034D95D5B
MKDRKNNSSTIKAAIYLRCSSDDQREGDFSTIDVQRELNLAHLADKSWSLAGAYSDEGRTGTNLKRAGWKQLLADAQEKKFEVVVITYMSRLGRGDSFVIAQWELQKYGVKVEMVKEKFTDDLAGYVNRSMTNVMDGMYAQMVRQWTRTKQESMVKQGYYIGGLPPYGYVSEPVPGMTDTPLAGGKIKPAPRRLVPHPELGDQVRRAFELVAETGVISEAQRYLTQVAPERPWAMSKVKNMLTNRRYLGELRLGEIVNESAFEAIISPSLWDLVQRRLAERTTYLENIGRMKDEPTQHKMPNRTDPISYFLRGRVICGHCGSLMTPAGHHGHTTKVGYYECLKPRRTGTKCPISRVNATSIHTVVTDEIVRLAEHPTRFDRLWRDLIRVMPQTSDLSEEVAKARRNRRETEKKITRLVESLKAGIPADLLANEFASLRELAASQEEQIKTLEARLAMGQPKRPNAEVLQELWGEFRENFEFLTEQEKSELLGLLIGPVTLTGRSVEGISAEIELVLSDELAEGILDSQFALKLQTPTVNVEQWGCMGAGEGLEPPTFGL